GDQDNLGGRVVGEGNRRHAREGREGDGGPDERAVGLVAVAVQRRREEPAEDGAEQDHLCEAGERDHLAVDLEGNASPMGSGGDTGRGDSGDRAVGEGGAPHRVRAGGGGAQGGGGGGHGSPSGSGGAMCTAHHHYERRGQNRQEN